MISVRTWKDPHGAYWFESSGHAANTSEKPLDVDGIRVCAIVSGLLVSLWAVTNHDGQWGGEGNGHTGPFRVKNGFRAYAHYVLHALAITNQNYPGYIKMQYGPGVDGEETWNKPLSPPSS